MRGPKYTPVTLGSQFLQVVEVIYGGGRRYAPLHFVVTAAAVSLGRLKTAAEADAESLDAAWRPVAEVVARMADPAQRGEFRSPDELAYVLTTALERRRASRPLPLQSLPGPASSARGAVLIADSAFGGLALQGPRFAMLEAAGWTVREYATTTDLLATLRGDGAKVAAVVASCMQSGGRAEAGLMGGLELLAQVRAEGPRPCPALCVCSATTTEAEAFGAGADCLARDWAAAEEMLLRVLGANVRSGS